MSGTDPSAATECDAMTGRVTLGTGAAVKLAGRGQRLGARVVDWVIMASLAVVPVIISSFLAFGWLFSDIDGELDNWLIVASAAILAALLCGLALYEVAMTARKGQTVGKQAMGIKVVRADSGEVPGWGRSVVRWFIPVAFSFACCVIAVAVGVLELVCLAWIVYLSMLWDKTRRGWYDKIAGTLVIEV